MNRTKKLREWLFPAILILFILQVILLPVMIGLTYATRSERPEHILTYTTGRLVWDKDTSVRPDGSAALSFLSLCIRMSMQKTLKRYWRPVRKRTVLSV